jgi:uncharacterized damage-inducible protein DinB
VSQITPEQAVWLRNTVFLPTYGAEHRITVSVIAAVPAERADYRPDPVVRNAIDLAWHIVAAEIRFMDAVASGAFDFGNSTRPLSIRAPADVVAWYTARFGASLERLKATSGDQLIVPIDFRGLFTFPAVVFLQSGISHTIHHRGQLSTYLRPMGAKVPSIYGESYDARMAREQAAPPSGSS